MTIDVGLVARSACLTPVRKLDPRAHVAHPGDVRRSRSARCVTTVLFLRSPSLFAGLIAVVAVAHRVVREPGRGRRRGARQGTGGGAARDANRDDGAAADAGGREEPVPGTALTPGDLVVVEAGGVIPGDGEVVEGVASVDESAITGESAPVIRESGGDRSAVTGGTKVLSDRIVVRITSRPGETFIDRMIALVEGAERQKTPNEIALDILLASLTIIFLLATVTLQPMAHLLAAPRQPAVVLVALLVCLIPTTIGALAVGHRHRRHGPPRAAQRARDVGPRGRGRRRREHAAARQDRHDHARQPAGRRVPAGPRRRRSRSSPTPRSSRASPTRRPRAARSSCSRRSATGCAGATSRARGSCRSPPRRA